MTHNKKYTCDSCKKDKCPLFLPVCMEGVYWAEIIIPQIGCNNHSEFKKDQIDSSLNLLFAIREQFDSGVYQFTEVRAVIDTFIVEKQKEMRDLNEL